GDTTAWVEYAHCPGDTSDGVQRFGRKLATILLSGYDSAEMTTFLTVNRQSGQYRSRSVEYSRGGPCTGRGRSARIFLPPGRPASQRRRKPSPMVSPGSRTKRDVPV